MWHKKPLFWIFVLLAFADVTCAPHDDAVPTPMPSLSAPNATQQTTLPPVPAGHKERIDAVLKHVRSRDLLKDHSFWTIFHGILGMGPEHAYLFDRSTGRRVKAIDYIADGGSVRGLEFQPSPDGLDVKTMAGSGVGQGHQDQFIAEMTQWGLPRDKKFIVNNRPYTFADFINHAKQRARVTADQELSWAILIVGQVYGPDHRWTNSFGETLSVEDMAAYELKQPIAESPVCGGTHRLFGFTWVYHLHRQKGGAKTGVWQEVVDTIARYKGLARKYQNRDGAFSTDYFRGPGNAPEKELRIATTGHILEWLALALPDAELREPWVQDAANALVLMILEQSFEALDGGALYHAAHGLEIYRARLFGAADAHGPVIPLPPKD